MSGQIYFKFFKKAAPQKNACNKDIPKKKKRENCQLVDSKFTLRSSDSKRGEI